MPKPIKVLVVDDSALMRKFVTDILSKDAGIEVMGTAMDGDIACRKCEKLRPDVVTMDVTMPRVDGLAALEHIMRNTPTPVLMLSSTTRKGALTTMEALELGAVDFLAKPESPGDIYHIGEDLRRMVRAVSHARVARLTGPARRITVKPAPAPPRPVLHSAPAAPKPAAPELLPQTGTNIIALGASTGGTEVLKDILSFFPAGFPAGILIAQHMPEGFTRTFAERLDQLCEIEVREARDGDVVRPGLALVAPGGFHMLVKRRKLATAVELSKGEKVSGHRPSVNVLFHSVAEEFGKNAVAAILTGMGNDGVEGIKEIFQKGGLTFAQNEKTCVVYGMPREAVRENCIHQILSPQMIAQAILKAVSIETAASPLNSRTGA